MTSRGFAKIASLIIFVTAIVTGFNNCASQHEGDSSAAGSLAQGLTYWSCSDQLDDLSLFGRTYHQFLQNNCASCHSGGGPGPGAFASSGIQLAYTSFDTLGFSRINTKALDGHSPASGLNNTATIDDLTARYVDGLATIETCKSTGAAELTQDQDSPTRIHFASKAINPNLRAPVSVTWDIATETLPLAGFVPTDFAGMRITVDVQVFQKPGIINYIISNPRLITNNGDVHIESLLFKINGKPTPAQRAFYLLQKDIRAWNNAHPDFGKPDPNPQTNINEFEYQARLISGGSLVMLGEVRSTDVISISVDKLQRVTLPPPDLGPSVRFGQTTMQVNENYQIVNIPLILNRPAVGVAFAEVVFGPETTVKDECCRSTRNDDGMAIQVRHFDRDIQDFDLNPDIKLNRRINFHSAATPGRYLISFRDGEQTQNLQLKIVADQRDEPNEVLHLQIDPLKLNNLVADTTAQEFRMTIVDNDQPYTGNAETYTDLLTDGGLLADECLRCHNSVLNRGGYDITHYELMVNRSVLIPGNPSGSLMFKRMDANTPGLAPMPLTGLLDPLDRARVSGWILLGAPNN